MTNSNNTSKVTNVTIDDDDMIAFHIMAKLTKTNLNGFTCQYYANKIIIQTNNNNVSSTS